MNELGSRSASPRPKLPGSRRGPGWAFSVLLALLPATGCQDGYPVTATRCDRWCEVTQNCDDAYEPALCVEFCEQQSGWVMAACSTEFDAQLACLDEHRSKLYCGMRFLGLEPACSDLQTKFQDCMRLHEPHGASGAN